MIIQQRWRGCNSSSNKAVLIKPTHRRSRLASVCPTPLRVGGLSSGSKERRPPSAKRQQQNAVLESSQFQEQQLAKIPSNESNEERKQRT